MVKGLHFHSHLAKINLPCPVLGQELITGFKAFISSFVGLCEFEDLRKIISPTIHEHFEKQNQIFLPLV